MKAFWIIAAIITAAYVVYYAVLICIDLYRKPDGEDKTDEETFELKNPAPANGRAVEVTDRGFRVAGGDGPDVDSVMPEVKDMPEPQSADTPPAPKLDASGAPVTPAGKKVLSVREDMEEIDPACSGEMTAGCCRTAWSPAVRPCLWTRPSRPRTSPQRTRTEPVMKQASMSRERWYIFFLFTREKIQNRLKNLLHLRPKNR